MNTSNIALLVTALFAGFGGILATVLAYQSSQNTLKANLEKQRSEIAEKLAKEKKEEDGRRESDRLLHLAEERQRVEAERQRIDRQMSDLYALLSDDFKGSLVRITVLEKQVQENNSKIDKLEGEVVERDAKIAHLTEENAELKAEACVLKAEVEQLKERLQRYENGHDRELTEDTNEKVTEIYTVVIPDEDGA